MRLWNSCILEAATVTRDFACAQPKAGDAPELTLKQEIRKEFDETFESVKDFGMLLLTALFYRSQCRR